MVSVEEQTPAASSGLSVSQRLMMELTIGLPDEQLALSTKVIHPVPIHLLRQYQGGLELL